MFAVGDTFVRTWRQTLSIATAFWGACLVLVAFEATIGANVVIEALFFVSIPLLVGFLTWANIGLVFRRPRSLLALAALGLSVLTSASVIIFVGLVAAANLEKLMSGA